MPQWLIEGIADVVAFRMLVRDGIIRPETAAARIQAARSNPVSVRRLEGEWPSGPDTQGVAYAAVEQLVARSGVSGLGSLCAAVGTGQAWGAAFRTVFGLEPEQFYRQFDAWLGLGGSASPSSAAAQATILLGPVPPWVTFSVGSRVPSTAVEDIRTGMASSAAFLRTALGGDPPRPVLVTVVSGEAAYCCTADGSSRSAGMLSFDVAHRDWNQDRPFDRHKIAAHEYAHTWQAALGCLRSGNRWIDEGIAEYVGYRAVISWGSLTDSDLLAEIAQNLRRASSLPPLRTLEVAANVGDNPYLSLYLAFDELAKLRGVIAIRRLCEVVASGRHWREAFQTAFGVPVDEFYASFEARRAALRAGP